MASKKSFNTRQVMAGFSVSDMTIFTWRTATKAREAIPHEISGRNVTFPEAAVKAWAKKYGKTFDVSKADAAPATSKTGPKATPPVKKAAKKMPVPKAKRGESRVAA